jgi:hypothetical protein
LRGCYQSPPLSFPVEYFLYSLDDEGFYHP